MRYFSVLALQALAVSASTVTFNWEIDWVSVSPDGYQRPAVGINGQWPCPTIAVNKGDRVVVNLKNNLGNETTAIHWHGIFQTGSAQMDGPAMVNQCPIPPGSSFVYDFTVDQIGTFWYHSHVGGQYIDGLRGPLIVHDPSPPYKADQEYVLTVSDWYHTQAPYLLNYFLSSYNNDIHGGSEPVPNATLINESQNAKFAMIPGKTYLFRVINMAAFAAIFVQFDQHDLTVVEIDGVYTQPHRVQQLFLTAAQRYSVLVTAKSSTKQNYAIVASMNDGMFDDSVIPPDLNNNALASLVYNPKLPLAAPFNVVYQEKAMEDAKFVPYDNMPILGPVTQSITFDMNFVTNKQNQNRGVINNVTFLAPKVPTLYTALSAPESLASNPLIYGKSTNPYVLKMGDIVELLVVNYDSGPHPFHLHSHNFQVLYKSEIGPDADGNPILPPKDYVSRSVPAPMRRDTVMVYEGGSVVLRFKVDNPGITLFHCHIEWHVEAGLTMVFIEAPTELRALNLVIPQSHKDACAKSGISMVGNAAGNSKNWLDLSGEATEPAINYWGALAKPPVGDAGYGEWTSSRVKRALGWGLRF